MFKNYKPLFSLIGGMLLFGPICIVREYIPDVPSGVFSCLRGIIAALFLAAIILIKKNKNTWNVIKPKLWLMMLSGAMIGFNWILLFDSCKYVPVATATLCYYMATPIVILLSPFLFKERITAKKLVCSICAVAGIVLVSKVFDGTNGDGYDYPRGIILGLCAAVLYAGVIISNKYLGEMPAYEKTMIQLGSAGIVVLPYSLIAEHGGFTTVNIRAAVLILLAGILFTGVPYALYFGSMKYLSAQTVAIVSYIDPVTAIILSALLLGQRMGVLEIVGAVLIIGSAVACEITIKKANKKDVGKSDSKTST